MLITIFFTLPLASVSLTPCTACNLRFQSAFPGQKPLQASTPAIVLSASPLAQVSAISQMLDTNLEAANTMQMTRLQAPCFLNCASCSSHM